MEQVDEPGELRVAQERTRPRAGKAGHKVYGHDRAQGAEPGGIAGEGKAEAPRHDGPQRLHARAEPRAHLSRGERLQARHHLQLVPRVRGTPASTSKSRPCAGHRLTVRPDAFLRRWAWIRKSWTRFRCWPACAGGASVA